jgi:hypothetical protein
MTHSFGLRQVMRSAGVIGGLAVWAVAGSPALPASPLGGVAPLGVGWARLVASGTVTAVSQSSHTVTLAIAGLAHLEEFAGGGAWRSQAFAGTRVVQLLPATVLIDAARNPLSASEVRTGVPSTIWAVVRPDGTILALALQVTSLARVQSVKTDPSAAPGAATAGTVGVVLERSGSMLDMLTPAGTRRSIVITAATAIGSGGPPVAGSALAPFDILRIEGPVNSDGSIAATRIDVQFATSSAAQVSGPVERSLNDLGGLVVGETMIATSTDTYIIVRAALARFGDLDAGHPVTVYGTTVRAGDTPIGLQARIVLAR